MVAPPACFGAEQQPRMVAGMMFSMRTAKVSVELPEALQPFLRGPVLGRFEGFARHGGLAGWVCRWPVTSGLEASVAPQAESESVGSAAPGDPWVEGEAQAPASPPTLRVRLTLEDLLHPGHTWILAELPAQRPRSDLPAPEVRRDCGFLFHGYSGVELPPPSSGLVVRAFALTPAPQELAGSPLRLSGEAYTTLQELCRTGLGHHARLTGLDGHVLSGWGCGERPLRLRLDGGEPLAVPPTEVGSQGAWAFELALPAALCDGAIHHLRLETDAGELIDERLELLPFHLTPWPALLEHSQAPFPDQISPLARERQRNLLGWLDRSDRSGQPLPSQLPLWQRLLSQPLRRDGAGAALPEDCEPGPDGEPQPRQPLQLPVVEQPQVAIVIPVHGQYAVTRRCLAAIAYAPTSVSYELIVVDDGSPDRTAEWLAREAPAVRVVRHDFARGFNQACCSGAAVASAEFVVLLNNDTEPCAHWLDELLAPFQLWPDTGLVGAQLVMADGRLQEAGGIIWGDGEPWNYGRGGNPYDPRYAYTREVDYVSGAALAIRKSVWRQVGGFSPEFSPAYYEDTDLAFKVRQAGFKVRYAPLARVIHHEGVSNGSDTEAAVGLKRFQEINAPLFRRKWVEAFLPSGEPSHPEAERIKDRGILGRALFLDHAPPRPDRDAGGHAAVVEMELLQSLGWKVSFLPATLAWLGRYTEALQRRGIEMLHAPFVLSLEQILRERGAEFDLIYLTRYTIAEVALPLIARYAPQARLLFCNADLHHLRELRAARALDLCGDAAERALQQVREVQQKELAVIHQVHLTFSYSEVEQAVIEAETLGRAPTATCPWVVEGPQAPAPLQGRAGLAFLGSYAHPPNCEAVEHFLDLTWPRIRQRLPDLQLHLYGSGMPSRLLSSWGACPGVRVEGWIADPAQLYNRHRLFIAPLRSGAGIKGKVAAAAAHGIPQVLSPVAAEATGLRHRQEIWIARDPEDWVEAVDTLCGDDALWQGMSSASHAYASQAWSRRRGLELMADALRRLHLPTPPRADDGA
ncbi:MAG: glycosyltransferase [Synechococcaceae cyanobacterium]|nr:glycosyltransferase [Synechococcaceae cyanobacterium]